MSAATVIFAVGNVARGDDGLGIRIAERLEALAPADVHLVVDQQLQIEHALDLEGRKLAIFVDAAVDLEEAFEFRRLRPSKDRTPFSHALAPEALLGTCERALGHPAPPALALAIRGLEFELGSAMSAEATTHLGLAWAGLQALLEDIRRIGIDAACRGVTSRAAVAEAIQSQTMVPSVPSRQ